jgi:hypothetical protein
MKLLVPTNYASVNDRATASLLRETYLEPALAQPDDHVEIDLNGRVRQLSVGAADELVGKFVGRLRKRTPHAVVIVRARSWDVLRNVHAALRDRSLAALAMNDAEQSALIPIGEVSIEERAAFDTLIEHGHASDEGLGATLAGMAERGLAVVGPQGYAAPELEAAPAGALAYA